MLVEVVKRIAQLLDRSADPLARGVSPMRLIRLVDEAMGEDLVRFADGRMLIWHIARHDGYRIPDYPMAGCGDVREFLADEGARNVPDWYRVHLGIDSPTYEQIWRYELVMVRNRALWRRVFLVPSGLTQARADDGPAVRQLTRQVGSWLAFALGEQTSADDTRLFRR